MEKTVTKHEWEQTFSIKGLSVYKCIHCPVEKSKMSRYGVSYYVNGVKVNEFPKCITRKIQSDGDSTAT